MKTYVNSGGIAPPFLTLAPDGAEWPASGPGLVYLRGKSPWVSPRACLKDVEKRKISFPWPESNSSRPARTASLYRSSYLIITLLSFEYEKIEWQYGDCKISPITVAARSKAWTVFASSNTGIVGSNPTRGIDICVRLFGLRCSVSR
jgi:hypothetical protein